PPPRRRAPAAAWRSPRRAARRTSGPWTSPARWAAGPSSWSACRCRVDAMMGRILIVDDEKALLLALRGLLSKEGYEVETATSGEEALRRIETGSFHLV